MGQIPSINWARRVLPLDGTEDLLKQNPISDVFPQEERIPISLIREFTLSSISYQNIGTGDGIFYNNLNDVVKLKSLKSTNSKLGITNNSNELIFTINSQAIAQSISLENLSNVNIDNGTGFLYYNGTNFVTGDIATDFKVKVGLDEYNLVDNNDTLEFISLSNNLEISIDNNKTIFNWLANLTDLSDVPNQQEGFLYSDGSTLSWNNIANLTGQNIGNDGEGFYKDKISNILNFKNLATNHNYLNISADTNNVYVDFIAENVLFSDLGDINIVNPLSGQTLNYINGKWTNVASELNGANFNIQTNTLKNITNGETLIFQGQNINITNTGSTFNFSLDANLEDLSNVVLTNVQNKDVLAYDFTNNIWKNVVNGFNINGNLGTMSVKNGDSISIVGIGGTTHNGIRTKVTNLGVIEIYLDAKLANLYDVPTPSTANTFLGFNGTSYIWSTVGGNNLVNENIGNGVGIYKTKVGNNLQLKSIIAKNLLVDVVNIGDEIEIGVNPQAIANTINLGDLFDVEFTNVVNNYDVVSYNSTNSIWENRSLFDIIKIKQTQIITADNTSISGITDNVIVDLTTPATDFNIIVPNNPVNDKTINIYFKSNLDFTNIANRLTITSPTNNNVFNGDVTLNKVLDNVDCFTVVSLYYYNAKWYITRSQI